MWTRPLVPAAFTMQHNGICTSCVQKGSKNHENTLNATLTRVKEENFVLSRVHMRACLKSQRLILGSPGKGQKGPFPSYIA